MMPKSPWTFDASFRETGGIGDWPRPPRETNSVIQFSRAATTDAPRRNHRLNRLRLRNWTGEVDRNLDVSGQFTASEQASAAPTRQAPMSISRRRMKSAGEIMPFSGPCAAAIEPADPAASTSG
jgi:hypothetical protein